MHTPVGYLYAGVMPPVTARLAAVLIALATALFVSACSEPAGSSSDGHVDHQQSDEPLVSAQPAGYNADDVTFATNMIPHHQQAIDLSALVPDRSTNPDLTKLASDIAAAQGPEIETMKVFLVQWNENPDTNTGSGHGGHGAMQGMVDEPTMARLASLKGAEFDTLWLQSMIGHHEGAIEMAKAEVANGENVDAKGMANDIITTQQAEIGQMKQMLGG
jgi:uncharacterized protein (DUF305 family)